MLSNSFTEVQRELDVALAFLLGKKQSGYLEKKAQQLANDVFQLRKARKKPVVLDRSGIQIIGCELSFDIGKIGIRKWLTAFYPVDVYEVTQFEPNIIPLGYINEFQLYLKGEYIVARHGMGTRFVLWRPSIQGVPPTESIFFVALERAKYLGHLAVLQNLTEIA